MVNRNVKLKVLIVSLVFLICGCGAPFKKFPGFDETQERIQTIALYPLHYTDDGEEERLFGMVFSEVFFESVEAMPMIRPLKFIEEDSTVSLIEAKGITITGVRTDIVEGSTFPIYKQLTPSDLQAVSKEAEVLILCNLLNYNEVGAGEELAQACATGLASACLTGGMVTTATSEQNEVSMKITLLETATGVPIWEYSPHFTASMSGEQRAKFTQNITAGFRTDFPLSANFEGK